MEHRIGEIAAHAVALVPPAEIGGELQLGREPPFLAREQAGRHRARVIVVVDVVGYRAGRKTLAAEHAADVTAVVEAQLAAQGQHAAPLLEPRAREPAIVMIGHPPAADGVEVHHGDAALPVAGERDAIVLVVGERVGAEQRGSKVAHVPSR